MLREKTKSFAKGESPHSSILVGVGGWAYFPIRSANKLEICSKLYDFAEVNSTFYKLPPLANVKRWRAVVPENFQFTIRAPSELTHEGRLQPSSKDFKIFKQLIEICRELDASVLHFQFPPSLEVTSPVLDGWREFMRSVGVELKARSQKLLFAFEVRNAKSSGSPLVNAFFEEYDIIPCGDASRVDKLGVSSISKVLYSRVFGLGEHTKWSFDTKELLSLAKKVESTPARRRYVTFHNVTMYEDAARMKNVVATGKDQVQKGLAGLDSLMRVIALGRVKYPVSRKSLFEEFGWRTVSLDGESKIRVGDVLKKLPEEMFESFEKIAERVRALDEA